MLHTVNAGHNVASMDVQWTGETPPNLQFIPGVIQAEAYLEQLGTGLEATTDEGGGQNVGYLDPGDYLGYQVEIESAGPHVMSFRTASESADGRVSMQLVDGEGGIHALGEFEFAATGGWQAWSTAEFDVDLPFQGIGLLQLSVLDAPFNLNWMAFERVVEGALTLGRATMTLSPTGTTAVARGRMCRSPTPKPSIFHPPPNLTTEAVCSKKRLS